MEEDDEPGPGAYEIPNTVVDPPRYLIPRPESLMQVYQY
jgi:hypothetical protein